MLVTLSGQITVIFYPRVFRFEGLIQKFEVTAPGMNVCGAWDINREQCSPIAWSFLAYRAVIHDGEFVRGWNGEFIWQNCPSTC